MRRGCTEPTDTLRFCPKVDTSAIEIPRLHLGSGALFHEVGAGILISADSNPGPLLNDQNERSPVDLAGQAGGKRRYGSVMFVVTRERFEELVADALDALPSELGREMQNVAVLVEDHAEGRSLFGLYEGIPLTRRGPQSYTGVMPDRITLYQDTICSVCSTEAEVVTQVRKTVIHEVAHHFGISDPRLDELGWA